MIANSYLFICSGNTCRSPMAEYIFKEIIKERKIVAEVSSRGLSVNTDYLKSSLMGVSDEACEAVREIYPESKIFLHDPTSFKLKDLLEFYWIPTMEERHRDNILKYQKYIPNLEQRVFALKEISLEDITDFNVSDPIGGGGYFYNQDYSGKSMGFSQKVEEPPKFKITDEKYLLCRNEITKYLKMLIQEKPDMKKILERRKKIKEEKEKLPKVIEWQSEQSYTPKRRKFSRHISTPWTTHGDEDKE